MQSDRRYRIDKYLEMARITKSEIKKEHFLDMAEHYLETEERLDAFIKNDCIEWIESCGKDYFLKLPIATAHEEFAKYAKVNGFGIPTKVSISKDIREFYQLGSKMVRLNSGAHRCFYKL